MGNNLRRYRHLNGYTQATLAEAIGKSTAFIGRVEIGQDFPSAETLKAIAHTLKIPIDYLRREKAYDPQIYRKSPVIQVLEQLTDDQFQKVYEAIRTVYENEQLKDTQKKEAKNE